MPKAIDLARKYRHLGFAPLPVPLREKGCRIKGWSSLIIPEQELDKYFGAEKMNIGVLLGSPSNELVDLDLDCAEAVQLVELLLPRTDMVFGRRSRPCSHHLYRVDDARRASKTFIDPMTKGMLLELRGQGQMTILPGSVHPTGEEVRFDRNGEPAKVNADELVARARLLAIATMLSRHWPEGARHKISLGLAAELLRAGETEALVSDVIDGICRVAGDEEREDRLTAVRTTAKRLMAGDDVAGLSNLADVLPSPMVERLADWFRLSGKSLPSPAASAPVLLTRHFGGDAPCSDVANAERFAALQSTKAVFCHELGCWFIWDGKRWAPDQNAGVERLAIETVKAMTHEAVEAGNQALVKWGAKSMDARQLRNMLSLAKSQVYASQSEFDRDPYLLNCLNGTLNLKTGQLQPHDPSEKLTKLAPVEFDPEAECPTWLQFLERIMGGKRSLVDFLQRSIGYWLTGDTCDQCMFVMVGSGANGKSTLLNAVKALLGDYADQTPMETLTVQRGGVPNDVARLRGARCVSALEAESGQRFAESKIKHMTGGEPVVARFLHKEFFTFVPDFKLVLATNELPSIQGTDEGIWRRIHIIPFDVQIPPEERDKHLGQRLKEEMSGILNWAVEGCIEWQRNGLSPPPEVLEATGSYRADMDVLSQFLTDCCVLEPDAHVSSRELYAAFQEWSEETGVPVLPKNSFGRRLKRLGFQDTRTSKSRGWSGVRLATAADRLSDDVTDETEPDPDVPPKP